MSGHCSICSELDLIKISCLDYLFKGFISWVTCKLFWMFPCHVEKSRTRKSIFVKELSRSVNVVRWDLSILLKLCEHLFEVVGSVVMPHSLEVRFFRSLFRLAKFVSFAMIFIHPRHCFSPKSEDFSEFLFTFRGVWISSKDFLKVKVLIGIFEWKQSLFIFWFKSSFVSIESRFWIFIVENSCSFTTSIVSVPEHVDEIWTKRFGFLRSGGLLVSALKNCFIPHLSSIWINMVSFSLTWLSPIWYFPSLEKWVGFSKKVNVPCSFQERFRMEVLSINMPRNICLSPKLIVMGILKSHTVNFCHVVLMSWAEVSDIWKSGVRKLRVKSLENCLGVVHVLEIAMPLHLLLVVRFEGSSQHSLP